ncbi:hypothetical protein HYV57_05595 [Candidatus Peregrinibacteria bacterium]|nr:hypothetical protein [Candidatus Peregrinibacteria bacterium]
MKKYFFITILAITLTTTGVAMASTGETPIDVIMKLLRFLRTDVEQLQTKTEEIQNQVSGIKSDKNLKVVDAEGKEVGFLIDSSLGPDTSGWMYRVYDTNINKVYDIVDSIEKMEISTSWYLTNQWFESEDCTGTPLTGFNTYVLPNPNVFGQDSVNHKYYTTSEYEEGELNSRLTYPDGQRDCVKMKEPSQQGADYYKLEEFSFPEYTLPLKIEVR